MFVGCTGKIIQLMKKSCIFIILVLLLPIGIHQSHAQKYGTSLGIRVGNNDYYRSIGISAEQRILKRTTFEGILQTDFNRNITGHLLLKNHRPILGKRFNYHYGFGISTGMEESYIKDPETKVITHTYGNATVGADLMLGVELTILSAVISVDYKPNFNFTGREEFYRGQVGISIRSVLVKSKELKKKRRQKARIKRRQERQERKKDKDGFLFF